MAHIHLFILIACGLVGLSRSQQKPIENFCRRWGHQTARVGSKLFIDGGMVGYNPLNGNYTNEYLLYSDLHSATGDAVMPAQYANLSKPGNIPSVSGGYIWADETNDCFYQFGGEYPDGLSPTEFDMWTYDVLLNQWNDTVTSGEKSLQRVSYGAGAQIESRGLGFYFGGWMSGRTTLGWKGPSIATNGLIRFDFSTGELKNISGPDNTGRAEGHMAYLPASDGGILVYFGGVEDPYHNGTFLPANMTLIHIFDIASSKWYTQRASGDVPLARRQFCADVTWPDDQSSYNIYLYGGYGFGEAAAFNDVYILSMPSFKWIKAYPTDGSDAVPDPVGHGGCSANVINRDQMLVIGGWFPSYDKCDSEGSQGQHNMVLGYNGGENKLWDKFDPQLSNYVVPTPIVTAIGGGTSGGATVTSPASWGHPDLATYYTIKQKSSTRTATRSVLSATASTIPHSTKKTNIAAIAGGVVGGLVALIVTLLLILWCLRRRKNAAKKQAINERPPSPPSAELAVTAMPHEMSTPNTASKYVTMHKYDRNPYSGAAQLDSHPVRHELSSTPYSAQMPPSYGSAPPFTGASHVSPTDDGYNHRSLHQQYDVERFSPNDGVGHNISPTAWDQPVHMAPINQHPYPYPTPTSPQRSPVISGEQQSQVYYPPPVDSTPRAHHSPTGTQFSGDTSHRHSPHMSNTTNPAQFYGQPTQGSSVIPAGDSHTPVERRPLQGRFVEDDHI